MLEWALANDTAVVDLAGSVDEGVRRFKLAFGGDARDYISAESFLAPSGLRAISRRVRAARGRRESGSART